MELRHLRYFLAVAQEQHFGRAAERLHMAQPPLSQAVRQLERELGARLFERTTRRVELTAAGQHLLARAEAILRAVDTAAAEVAGVAGGRRGRLSLGVTGSATYELLPRVARALADRMPDVALDLRGELLTPRSVSGLLDGSLDLALLRPPVRADGLAVHVVRSEPLIAALPAGHALAGQERVPLADLAEDPFVVYPSLYRSVVHDAVLDACQRAGFEPRIAQRVGETSTLAVFVAAGLGVALVPESVRHLQIPGVVYRSLAGTEEQVALALAYRAEDPSPLLARVLSVVRDVVERSPDDAGAPSGGPASVERASV